MITICAKSFGQEVVDTVGMKAEYERLKFLDDSSYQEGKFQKGSEYAEKTIDLCQHIYGEEHQEYEERLSNLAVYYIHMGRYEEALPLCKKAIEITDKIFGKEHIKYAETLYILVHTYNKMGRYEEALPLCQKVIEIMAKPPRIEHQSYATYLNMLAVIYYKMGRHKDAIPLYNEALKITAKTLGIEHQEYGILLNNLASFYKKMGRYEEALPLFHQALEVIAKTLGKEHPNYGIGLNNLAAFYTEMGRYEEALILLLEALEVFVKVYGKMHPNYGVCLTNLSTPYIKTGRYEKALPLLLEALELTTNALGKNHESYGIRLNNLAMLYGKMGIYEKALPLYHEAIDVTIKILGKEHDSYGSYLNNLAMLYSDIGRYREALPIMVEALKITAKVLGKKHERYGTRLNNLARLYTKMNRYEEALLLVHEGIEVVTEAFGKEHADYGVYLSSLALLYVKMSRHKEALPLYQEAIEITVKAVGKEHDSYGALLNYLALLYVQMGKYEEALPLFQEAIEVTTKVLGKEHEDYEARLNNIMQNYEAIGTPLISENYIIQLININQRRINFQIAYVSENIQKDWLNKSTVSNVYQSFLQRHSKNNSLIIGIVSYQFLLNSFQLFSKKQLNSYTKIATPEIKTLHKKWLSYKKHLARQMSLPIDKRMPNVDSVTQIAERLETELAANSKEFAVARKSIELKDVQKALKPNEALLQFSDFRYYNVNKWTDSTLYIVYLVHPNKAPEMVYLFEQKQLDSLFTNSTSSTKDFYTMRSTFTPIKSKNILNQKLYKLIWKPLLPYLEGINTLYINPSGLLHKINLAAIPIDSTSRISDKFKVNYISSARDFVLPKEKKYENTALILGGLDYDEYAASTDSTAIYYYHDYNEVAVTSNPKNSLRTLRDSTWIFLKGAKIEAKKISRLLSKKSYEIAHLTDKNGTEHAIKYYGRDSIVSPRILHIATHGFSFPAPQDQLKNSIGDENPYRMAEDPLFRSGLLLSGANKAWQGQSPPKGQEDGILTAYEISHLDLTETELVVLSACKTGVGDIDSHEGVYGLQRGFKLAGVKYIIMSLWDVPDKETQEMMVLFYKKWLDGGLAIPAAFRAAQEEMRREHEGRPELWAGFVLVE